MSFDPGFYDGLRNETYHADDSISSSYLKGFLPEQFKAGAGNTEALTFGTLVHTAVLEPDNLSDYKVLDPFVVGIKADGSRADNPTSTKAWKVAVAEAERDGLTVVSPGDWDRANRMVDALHDHGEASELLFKAPGRNEVSAFAVDENGHRVRARFDRLLPGVGVDLKTTFAKPGAHSLTKVVTDYLYDLSAAHYVDTAELLGERIDEFVLIFVGKDAPYRVTVAQLDDTFLAMGRQRRALALSRATNPDVEQYEGATGRLTLTAPFWALEEELEIV